METKEEEKFHNDELKSFKQANSFYNPYIKEINNNNNQEYKEPLSQSSTNNNPLIHLQQKFFGKGKEVSPTIFDEKMKKQSSKEVPKIMKEEEKINKADLLQVRKIKKISDNEFEILKNQIIERENLDYLYEDILNYNYLPLNEIDFSANVGCMLPFATLVESLFNNNIITILKLLF